ncbi:unnamed protein product [Lactuca saligna]|nr:unnamed protein product [Lactuca saligna]
MLGLRASRAQYKRMEWNLPLKKDICLTQAFRSHFLLKEDRKKLKVEKEGSDVYEQNEPQIEKADQGRFPFRLEFYGGKESKELELGIRDRFTPRGAYTSRLSKFCSKTSSENLYREGFPAAQQFFHTNLAARRCYWHNNRRYTIRAGRYLCDKEFRYLRTVRVTAAVYRGFHSKLITLLLPTFQHRAGVRLYTSCYHLAESCVFNKQSLPPGMCRFPNQKIGEHPFSRSYGVILPSSFDMVLSSALVYSTCSPVSVWGTAIVFFTGFIVTHVSILTSDISRFRGKPAISDLGWPFTPSHKSSPYFATYVGSVLQGLLELSSTCSWLDRSVSGQIGRTRRFHLWKAPTPNGLSRCSHFLADPSCKRYAVRASAARFALQAPPPLLNVFIYKESPFSRREEGKLSSRSLLVFPSSNQKRKRMKPGEKEMNTLLRNEASSLFFFKAPIRSRSPLLTGSRLISLPLATQMFQFAKFEKSKERRLATELGYGFPIGDPWITDGISPWPFASESVLPSQCPGIHPMHSFRSCTHGAVH